MVEDDGVNSVVLVISQGDREVGDDDDVATEVDARLLGCEEWESLIAQSDSMVEVRIRLDRDLLSRHSTYFRGYRNFREAECENVNVDWVLSIFLILLKCIHGCRPCLSSPMIAPFIQSATYFGVEEAIIECEEWADSTMCKVSWGAEDDFLSHLLSIWDSTIENGVYSLRELCSKGLAINFAEAVLSKDFVVLPILLLEACVNHPELTIQSEQRLCDALLLWYENQKQYIPGREDPSKLLKKIELSLLPIEYLFGRLVGKYPLSMFTCSSTPGEFHSSLLVSIYGCKGELPSQPIKDLIKFKPAIRITDHLEELDLSGCQQITCQLLLSSAAQAPNLPKYKVSRGRVDEVEEAWPDLPQLKNLKLLKLSQCWRLEESMLLKWLKISCPNLTELRVCNCPQLQVKRLPLLALQHLSILDLSEPEELVEIEGAVTRTKSALFGRSLWVWNTEKFNGCNNLREILLRGRSDLTDAALLSMARNCPSLIAVDLCGCLELTDGGISTFLELYRLGFKKFHAAGTEFGPACCEALIQPSKSDGLRPTPAGAPVASETHILDDLDLQKCSVLTSEHLQCLLQALPSLVSLSLAFTSLDDSAFSAFSGTNLQHLNIRETKVSGSVFALTLARNTGLKNLNTRGCTGMASYPFDRSPPGKVHGWEDVEVGWGISDSALMSLGFASARLQSLVVGIGGTISAASLLYISEHCQDLKRLSLCFQVIPDTVFIRVLKNLKHLHTLELQNLTDISRNFLRELLASNGANLRRLRFERVSPWLVDNDILSISEFCTGLQSLSIMGCQALSCCSVSIIANRLRSLRDLKLEDCNNIISRDNAALLMTQCPALEVLHLRHVGKGLPQNFIVEASRWLPLLRKLAIDLCDAADNTYSVPEGTERHGLRAVYMNRCRSDKHAFRSGTGSSTGGSTHYLGRIHKETVVLEWNSVRLKESVVRERLTFD